MPGRRKGRTEALDRDVVVAAGPDACPAPRLCPTDDLRECRPVQALVKAKREEGLWLEDVPEPEIGINDVLIRVHKTGICGTDLHIYSWDALGAEDDPGADGDRPRVRRRGRRRRLERERLPGRRPRQRRGARRLRALPQLHGRPAPPLRALDRPRRAAARARSPSSSSLPMTNIWHHWAGVDEDVAAIFDPFGNAVHTALTFPVLGEDVLVTGAGPIGCMACRRRPARRRTPRRRLRPEPLPPRAGGRGWARRSRSTRRQRDLADVQRELGMTEGFDIALEMSGNPDALREHDRQHGARRPDRGARHPDRRRPTRPRRRSSSTCSRSRASTAARCTRPGTR